jgi:hypothetical protein
MASCGHVILYATFHMFPTNNGAQGVVMGRSSEAIWISTHRCPYGGLSSLKQNSLRSGLVK